MGMGDQIAASGFAIVPAVGTHNGAVATGTMSMSTSQDVKLMRQRHRIRNTKMALAASAQTGISSIVAHAYSCSPFAFIPIFRNQLDSIPKSKALCGHPDPTRG